MSQSRFVSKIYADVKKYDNNLGNWVDINSNSTIGDLKFSVRTDDHLGYLLCDGRNLTSTDYPDLFAIIGTTFGGGEGTFNLPDCAGRVLGTAGSGSGLTTRQMGDVVGEEVHTMTLPELISHTHTGTSDAAGSHTHTHNSSSGPGNLGLLRQSIAGEAVTGVSFDSGNSGVEADCMSASHVLSINSVGDHQHTFTSNSSGGSTPFNVIQPTLFIGHVFIYALNVFLNTPI